MSRRISARRSSLMRRSKTCFGAARQASGDQDHYHIASNCASPPDRPPASATATPSTLCPCFMTQLTSRDKRRHQHRCAYTIVCFDLPRCPVYPFLDRMVLCLLSTCLLCLSGELSMRDLHRVCSGRYTQTLSGPDHQIRLALAPSRPSPDLSPFHSLVVHFSPC